MKKPESGSEFDSEPLFISRGSSSGIQQIGVVLILIPASRIAENVFADVPEVIVGSNNVFVVIALPQSSVKRCPLSLSHARDVFMGCHGFEGLYYLSQRPRHRPAGAILVIARIRLTAIIRVNTRFAPTVDHNDSVHMIWHYHERIQFRSGKPAWQCLPNRPHHPSGIIQPHLSAIRTSQRARPIPRADRHEVRPWLGIVMSLEADGAAMVFVRVVCHGLKARRRQGILLSAHSRDPLRPCYPRWDR